MKVDDLYMENLTEYVFDEKQFVAYKFLSIKLGVHVNLAKQMLYHFYDSKKSEGKKIHAMYYLSGLAPQQWISKIGRKKESEEDEFSSQDSFYSQESDKDAYLVMLCKDHELEDFKKKFSRLYSVHVYGLSSFPLESFDVLNQAVEKPLRDDDGNAPVHFGPITCKAAFEYRENPVIAPLLKNLQEVKANLVKTKEKIEKDKEQIPKVEPVERAEPVVAPPSKAKQGTSTNTSKKHSNTSNSNGGPDRLKNMFAAAASRPKSKEVVVEKPKVKEAQEVVEVNDDSSDEMEEKSSKSTKNKFSRKAQSKAKSKGRESQSRKRKRIRDVFSSSDEDEEKDKNKMSDDEEDCLPESPIPRKKIQIESDSEDEVESKQKTPLKPEVAPAEKTASGKRRVCKSIPRRHVDDEGFLVTVMEQVMVSESDQSEDEKETKKSEKKGKNSDKDSKSATETVVPPARKKESSRPLSTTSNSSNSSKPKQASIMSFFQKK